jgi:hypothetical protein
MGVHAFSYVVVVVELRTWASVRQLKKAMVQEKVSSFQIAFCGRKVSGCKHPQVSNVPICRVELKRQIFSPFHHRHENQ